MLPDLQQTIQRLCEEADQFTQNGQWAEAEARYDTAIALVPEPQEGYPIYSWMLFSLGELLTRQHRFQEAFVLLVRVDQLEKLNHVAEFHLALGQAAYGLGHQDLTERELQRALELAGPAIFEGHHPIWLRLARGENAIH